MGEGREEDDVSFIDTLFMDDTTDAARYGLLMLMTGISESAWCAAWMSDLSYALWDIKGGTQYGQDIITDRQATLLKLLSEEAGGWWVFDKDKGACFITDEQWSAIRTREGEGK